MKFSEAIETMNDRKHAAFDGKFNEGDIAPQELWGLCLVGIDVDLDDLIESCNSMAVQSAQLIIGGMPPFDVLRTVIADAAAAGMLAAAESERSAA
jgi:hypothetical protein